MVDTCLIGPLKLTVNVKRVSSYSNSGEETLASVIAMDADVQVVDAIGGAAPGGTQRVSKTLIFTKQQIYLDDRVWLPWDDSTNENHSRAVNDVRELYDFNGAVSHYETTV